MKGFIIISSWFLIINSASGQSKSNKDYFLDPTSTSLKGKTATTIITNHTTDTFKLESKIIYYLPLVQKAIKSIIPPRESDTLKANLNYPDFIRFTSLPLQIFNAPGKIIRCEIESINPIKVTFKGDLYLENNYYQDYHKRAISNNVYYALPRSVFIGKDMKIINNNYKRAGLITAADIEDQN